MFLHDRPSLIPSNILAPPSVEMRFQPRSSTWRDSACPRYSPSTHALRSPIIFLLKFRVLRSGLDERRPLDRTRSELSDILLLLRFRSFNTRLLERLLVLIQLHRSITVLKETKLVDKSKDKSSLSRFLTMYSIPFLFLFPPSKSAFGLTYLRVLPRARAYLSPML